MTNSSVTLWNFLEFACGVWGVCLCVNVSVRSRVNRECGTRRQKKADAVLSSAGLSTCSADVSSG